MLECSRRASRLELRLPGRRPRLPGHQSRLSSFEEVRLPPAHRLLRDLLLDLLLPGRLSHRHLTNQNTQHDPGPGLRTEHWWSSHGQVLLLSDADHALTTGQPESLTRDKVAKLGRTLAKRRDDSLAFFDHTGSSNGPMEAINGRIEHLRGAALRFRNLTH